MNLLVMGLFYHVNFDNCSQHPINAYKLLAMCEHNNRLRILQAGAVFQCNIKIEALVGGFYHLYHAILHTSAVI